MFISWKIKNYKKIFNFQYLFKLLFRITYQLFDIMSYQNKIILSINLIDIYLYFKSDMLHFLNKKI